MPFLDFDGLKEFKATENSTIASVESTTTASKAYNIGDFFWYAGKLYKATAPIASGATITIGTNCSLAPLANDVSALKSAINTLADGSAPVDLGLVPNEYVEIVHGNFTPYNNWSRTGYIPVTPGEKIYYLNTLQCAYNCWYDGNHEKIGNNFIMYAGTLQDGSSRYVTAPSGAAYVAMSNTTVAMQALSVWKISGLIDDTKKTITKTYSSQKISDLIADLPIIVLPSALYVAEGSTINIYTDNIVIGDYSRFAITWQINNISWTDQYDDRFAVHPSVGDAGDYTILFILRDKKTSDLIVRREIPLHVVQKKTLTGKKVLFIGDSLTAAGYYPYEIQHNLSENGIESIGTLTAHPYFDDVAVSVQEEGRGGWAAYDYVTYASKASFTNAFWNPASSKFDFAYYLTQNEFSAPDIVFLNLGTNGVEAADREVAAITEMISSIHAYSADIPIAVSLISPPATQDGWTSQTHGGSVDRFKRLQLLLNQAYIDAFDNKIANVYVSPVYFNLDRKHDFPYSMEEVSSRNPYEVYRQTDNVHPSKYGYFKFADVYWGMIQHLLA